MFKVMLEIQTHNKRFHVQRMADTYIAKAGEESEKAAGKLKFARSVSQESEAQFHQGRPWEELSTDLWQFLLPGNSSCRRQPYLSIGWKHGKWGKTACMFCECVWGYFDYGNFSLWEFFNSHGRAIGDCNYTKASKHEHVHHYNISSLEYGPQQNLLGILKICLFTVQKRLFCTVSNIRLVQMSDQYECQYHQYQFYRQYQLQYFQYKYSLKIW